MIYLNLMILEDIEFILENEKSIKNAFKKCNIRCIRKMNTNKIG